MCQLTYRTVKIINQWNNKYQRRWKTIIVDDACFCKGIENKWLDIEHLKEYLLHFTVQNSLVLYNIGVTDLMALTYWIANLLLQVYDLEMLYSGFKHTQNLKQFVVSLDCVC